VDYFGGFFEIPIPLRPCPDCGEALWGDISVEVMPLTGGKLKWVSGVDPRRLRTDGSPALRQINSLEPGDVEAFAMEHPEYGWCPRCAELKPTQWREPP